MTLQVFALASGSSGNAMLVRGDHGDLLLDCGMSRAFIEDAFRTTGGSPDRLRAVVLTHEHADHSRGAMAVARRFRVPVIASRGTLAALPGLTVERELPPESPLQLDEFEVVGFPVRHDAREPLALSVSVGSQRILYAVDLGYPSAVLIGAARSASLVILESNHDIDRLIQGPYDTSLKQRILGDSGHLSNEEAGRVISEVSHNDRPTQFWLAHLSAVNNTPNIALRSARRALNRTGHKHCCVDVAARDRPSLHWDSSKQWWQPALDFGP